MKPRVTSPAAVCGRSPVASIGRRFAPGIPAANEQEAALPDPELEAIPAKKPLKDQGDAIDAME